MLYNEKSDTTHPVEVIENRHYKSPKYTTHRVLQITWCWAKQPLAMGHGHTLTTTLGTQAIPSSIKALKSLRYHLGS